eukprot:8108729-Heterocapsa_arctica.AAC.1
MYVAVPLVGWVAAAAVDGPASEEALRARSPASLSATLSRGVGGVLVDAANSKKSRRCVARRAPCCEAPRDAMPAAYVPPYELPMSALGSARLPVAVVKGTGPTSAMPTLPAGVRAGAGCPVTIGSARPPAHRGGGGRPALEGVAHLGGVAAGCRECNALPSVTCSCCM